MKTDDLIRQLSEGLEPAAATPAAARILPPAAIGAVAGLALVVFWLQLLPLEFAARPLWWLKFGYGAALASAGGWMTLRLARPSLRSPRPGLFTAAALAGVMFAAALATLVLSPADERAGLVMGQTWKVCSALIMLIAAPIFAGALIGLRRLAPTRPALAGAAAGLFAGGLAAALYALHCPELAPPFVAAWYTLGVALSALLGAVIGSRLLRW